jgi:glycerate 2-kinase
MKRILIAPNSFKECLSSVDAADYFKKYLSPEGYTIITRPISDGGDGFLNICSKYYNLKILDFEVCTTFNDKNSFIIPVGYSPELKSVVIESAEVIGLSKIPINKRSPSNLSSIGLGELLNKIKLRFNKDNLEKIIIGIGGTGTIDMGIGILSALGLRLLDKSGSELVPIPKNFIYTKRIIYPSDTYPFTIELIVDVNNPLTGENGGIKVYGKQKGASDQELIEIENGIKNLLGIFEKDKVINKNSFLSGAGGGIPAGLSLLSQTKVISSQQFIMDNLNLRQYDNIDYLITGEGKFDSQSYFTKGTGIVINQFRNVAKIFLCCGIIEKSLIFPSNLYPIQLLDYFKTIEESMNNIEKGIEFACSRIRQIIC